jgi:hypothetical protein
MAIRFAPVHQISAEGMVHLVVNFTQRQAAKRNPRRLDSRQDRIKFALADPETIVLLRNVTRPLVKVDRQPVIHEHRRERTKVALLRPRHTQKPSEQSRARDPVPGWNDQVVKLNGHSCVVGGRLDAIARPCFDVCVNLHRKHLRCNLEQKARKVALADRTRDESGCYEVNSSRRPDSLGEVYESPSDSQFFWELGSDPDFALNCD